MINTLDKTDFRERLVSNFSEFEKYLNGKATGKVHELRQLAISRFSQTGFPTTKMEDWKYTTLKPLLEQEFTPALELADESVSKEQIEHLCLENTWCMVFVNGWYSKKLSNLPGNSEGIIVTELQQAFKEHPELADKYFIADPLKEPEPMVNLNTAFTSQGVFVHVSAGKQLDRPVHLLYINNSDHNALLGQTRNIFVAGRNAHLSVIESYHSISDNTSFTNIVSDFFADENSFVDYSKIQDENIHAFHVGTARVQMKSDCNFTALAVTTGGRLVRNNLDFVLDGQNCNAHLYGLYLPSGRQHFDNHTTVEHAKPHSFSNELYKGIIDGHGTGVFNGRIIVRPDAQKTNAFQSNKNILLSNDANINAKPQLEIYADDVKCSHGATTGEIDKEMLFYLRSRGLGEAEATAFLNTAFAQEIVDMINHDQLREKVAEIVDRKLRNK